MTSPHNCRDSECRADIAPLPDRLRAMPSSLNDACRTMEEAADRIEELTKALEQIRTSRAGYCITDPAQYPDVLADMWKEVRRMDSLARSAVSLENRK